MKKIFTLALLLPSIVLAQKKYVLGVANFQTNMYDLPSNVYDFSINKTLVKDGAALVIYNYLDTPIGNSRSTKWLKCVYNKKTEWIPFTAVNFKATELQSILSFTNDGENERLAEALGIEKQHIETLIKKEEEEATTAAAAKEIKLNAITAFGAAILQKEFTNKDYGVDFYIAIANFYKSPIKYAWATLSFYNAVDDIIGSETVKMVGPIAKSDHGSYKFENVIYTRIFNWGKITKLKIQYMDGRVKEIIGDKVYDITYY